MGDDNHLIVEREVASCLTQESALAVSKLLNGTAQKSN